MSPGVPTLPRIELARWLPASTPELNRRIVKRALLDVGVCEIPPGSNRSGVIDDYNQRASAPVGSFWCAAAVHAWWQDAGAAVPEAGPAGCDEWMKWAKKTGRWSDKPSPGAAVVYGKPTDANHIGVIVRVDPILESVEGNTTIGGAFNRNGVAVDLKSPELSRVLGYIHPRPL